MDPVDAPGAAVEAGLKDLVVDLTAIAPGASGGVEAVAVGIVSGLLAQHVSPRCLILTGTSEQWRRALNTDTANLAEIRVMMRSSSPWQAALRRILPPALKTSGLVGIVRRLRSQTVGKESGQSATWFPFHRTVVSAETSIVTVHDLRVFEPALSSTMDQQIIRANIAKATAVVCSWPHPYNHLVRLFPEAASKAFLIPLPILNPGPPVKRSLPIDGPVRLFYPGSVTSHKNHEVIIHALAKRPNYTLVCTGSEVEPHATYLRSLTKQLGVSDRVEWRGYVTTKELEQEYQKAHVLVMPSKWEAASGPIFEAIVRELPFIASDIPPIVAQLNAIGLRVPIFPCDDASAAAEALDDVVGSYSVFHSQLSAPAERLRSRTWKDTSSDYLRVFNWASGSGPKPDHLQPSN